MAVSFCRSEQKPLTRPLTCMLPHLYLLTTEINLIQIKNQRLRGGRGSPGPHGECGRIKTGRWVVKATGETETGPCE